MSAPDVVVTLTYTEEEAREVARAFLYFTSNVSATHEDHDRMTLIREAIKRALPKPKPDEPQGLFAVVEDEPRARWVRCYDDEARVPWNRIGTDAWASWPEIAAVRVLSDGVTS